MTTAIAILRVARLYDSRDACRGLQQFAASEFVATVASAARG